MICDLTHIILTGKTAGYDRPRHLVLQILWGIIHRSNINYAERIWEEFVQSIQTFLTDKKNLTTASRGKKKTAHLLIPSVRKDGKEIFGMPIPDALLTDEIKGAPYYGEYQEHVAKYQQYSNAEHGKSEEGGATESPKATKVTKPKAAKATKPAGDKDTPNEPSLAKRLKGGLVRKIRKPKNPLKLVDKPSDEALTDSEMKSNNVVPKINTGDQNEGQAGPTPGKHDEGHAGPNPGVQDEGQAKSNPGDGAESHPQSSHVVHVVQNLEHMDLKATDASTQ
nr:hypothetical protein [Tanacetum cinerariifolium]